MSINEPDDSMAAHDWDLYVVDMSEKAINARLKAVDELRRLMPDPKHPDMSPVAIAARLKMVEQLRRLCVSLRAASEKRKPPLESSF
jgi:hypothetical protein